MSRFINRSNIPIIATGAVCLLLYVGACLRHDAFFSWSVFLNFFRDNSFLGLTALGMTFVILSGGIDLSVGAMIALVSIVIAQCVGALGMHPLLVLPMVVIGATLFGTMQGWLIAWFQLPPFLVTLAGMFLARGMALVISLQTLSIEHPFFAWVDDISYEWFPVTAAIFLAAFVTSLFVQHHTRFGRAVYAIGGNEESAVLMGLPVRFTTIGIYAFSGCCSGLAGVVYTFYTQSGNANAATMLELDAIAAVVIGGTLLSGGVGGVGGTMFGVLILGIIQTAITFEGTLSSWWTKIVIGVLVLLFILLQTFVQSRPIGRSVGGSA